MASVNGCHIVNPVPDTRPKGPLHGQGSMSLPPPPGNTMNRITLSNLQAVVDRINKVTNSPTKPYIDGKAQIGCYHLSQAYGGVCLHRMHNEGGGVSDVLSCGHVSKKELYTMMHAWLRGRDSMDQGA